MFGAKVPITARVKTTIVARRGCCKQAPPNRAFRAGVHGEVRVKIVRF
jgi:hypothetical protein